MPYIKEKSMDTAKLFKTGRSQAVRLPKEYRFEGEEVYIKRVGPAVVLLPRKPKQTWSAWFAALAAFDNERPIERERITEQQHRPSLDTLFADDR
jgi:antitoxin VapB